jgi:hypothetical protein
MTLSLRILSSLALLACARAACPFGQLGRRADESTDPLMARALQIGAQEFCGLPHCNPATGRKLLAAVELGSNGKPTLVQATVDAIEEDFCALTPTAANTRTAGCGKGVQTFNIDAGSQNQDRANEERADVLAGAIQLAFHDAGTWDASKNNKGGMDGCACDLKEANKGLDYIKALLEPVYSKYSSKLSRADFWAIVGNAAVKASVPAADAPLAVGFKYGRSDVDCSSCTLAVADRLPNENFSADHVKEVFVDRMGFSQKETVALMGAHSLGKMEPHNTGYAGKWDRTFSLLDTEYFKQILNKPWERFTVDEKTKFGGSAPYQADHSGNVDEEFKHEWRVPGTATTAAFQDSTDKLLNTDMCLAWDIGNGNTEVNTLKCTTRPGGTATTRRDGTCTHGLQTGTYKNMASAVAAYADASTGQAAFLKDFAAAWQKLMELTPNTLVAVGKAQTTSSTGCTDDANAWMTNNGKACATYTWGMDNKCNKDAAWAAAKTCQQSCFNAGNGYEGDSCTSLAQERDTWEEAVTPLPM